MKKIEGIYDSDKFGKKELRKIKGGVKATATNHNTNIPRAIGNGNGNGNAYGHSNGNGQGQGYGNAGGFVAGMLDSDSDS